MTEEAAKEITERFDKINELVAAGILSDEDDICPRLFWLGHKLLNSWAEPDEFYTCVKCLGKWFVARTYEKDEPNPSICPSCQTPEFSYRTNYERRGRWQCLSCSHEWNGEDGTTCPACKDVRTN